MIHVDLPILDYRPSWLSLTSIPARSRAPQLSHDTSSILYALADGKEDHRLLNITDLAAGVEVLDML